MIDSMWMWMLYQVLCCSQTHSCHKFSITDWELFTYRNRMYRWTNILNINGIPIVCITWVIDQIFHALCVTIYLATVKLNLIKAFRNCFFFTSLLIHTIALSFSHITLCMYVRICTHICCCLFNLHDCACIFFHNIYRINRN